MMLFTQLPDSQGTVMKTRLSLVFAVALMLVAVSTADASTYSARVICGASCSVLQTENASGRVRVDGNGTAYGQVAGASTIRIKDRTRDGKKGFSVSGWTTRTKSSTGWWTFKGHGMSFLIEKAFGLRIRGGQTDARVVASGSAYLSGTGRYQLNGVWHTITLVGRSLAL
jgi:hypothetical protein